MPAWKQRLHREARAEGHSLAPITRTSLKPKGAELHQTRNSYATACSGCDLKITIQTFPGTPAAIERKGGSEHAQGTSRDCQ